jgi:hypothetical protein
LKGGFLTCTQNFLVVLSSASGVAALEMRAEETRDREHRPEQIVRWNDDDAVSWFLHPLLSVRRRIIPHLEAWELEGRVRSWGVHLMTPRQVIACHSSQRTPLHGFSLSDMEVQAIAGLL